MKLHSMDQKLTQEVKILPLSLRMVKICQEHTWDHFLGLKVKKCRIKCFWGFISDFCRVCPAMTYPTRHSGPALVGIISPYVLHGNNEKI